MVNEPDPRRAVLPTASGAVVRDGVRIAYDVYGSGPHTVLLLPTWSIVHARLWKMQVPYLGRHARVITFDGRGNGRSDRPEQGYADTDFVADAIAVLDVTGTASAAVVGVSRGARYALLLAAEHPERVTCAVFIAPATLLGDPPADRSAEVAFDDRLEHYEGWQKFNRHYWLEHYQDFLEFFFAKVVPEPHSTKLLEDLMGWGLDTTPQVLVSTAEAPMLDADAVRALSARVRCPCLVIQGDDDRVSGPDRGRALADALGAPLVTLAGSGHAPQARDPVCVNRLIRNFALPAVPPERWARGPTRPRRALVVCSPIGLGHAWRDVAVARELRRMHPGLQIDWLAQPPVSGLLDACGERVHPASALLASEACLVDAEAGEHELHAFHMLRRMDEIFCANFMVFHDVAAVEHYDLWLADEAWEVDHFLFENPELKTARYAWMTDFVGLLPMASGGSTEAALVADYNAEMLEHVARHPRLRDRAVFIGDAGDVVHQSFGPGLPDIHDWTAAHYEFSGYVTAHDPDEIADRESLRAELGYGADEKICVVATGGSAAGIDLLRRAVAAVALARRTVPELRALVIAGPRIDPTLVPRDQGIVVEGYVHRLYRHLAACDVGITHGGLASTMELTAARRPFLYFPLRNHFEQVHHVAHRLDRHRSGRRMDFHEADARTIADALIEELDRPVQCRPVDCGAARRAAAIVAELL